MDIKEIQKLKTKTEKEIIEIINKFIKESNTIIDSVSVNVLNHVSSRGVVNTSFVYKVDIKVYV